MIEGRGTELQSVEFHNDSIDTFEHGGEPYVAMRRVVENLGLSWGSQREKLAAQASKFMCADIGTHDSSGRLQQMFAMPVAKLPLWLATINPNKIKEEAKREKIELYQAESAIALHDYWTKGAAFNRSKLASNDDALDEAMVELRRLRANDRAFYRKVTDAIAATSYDYAWMKENSPERLGSLFARLQDTFHMAVCGKTAQQLVYENADGSKPLVGMIAFDGDPTKITVTDVRTGKNYLTENPLRRLENLYEQLFLFAEQHMLRGEPMSLATWEERLLTLLNANGYESFNLYSGYGAPAATAKARDELKKYKQRIKALPPAA